MCLTHFYNIIQYHLIIVIKLYHQHYLSLCLDFSTAIISIGSDMQLPENIYKCILFWLNWESGLQLWKEFNECKTKVLKSRLWNINLWFWTQSYGYIWIVLLPLIFITLNHIFTRKGFDWNSSGKAGLLRGFS